MVYPLYNLSTQDLLMILGITGARCILSYVIVRILHVQDSKRKRRRWSYIINKNDCFYYLINIKDQPSIFLILTILSI